MLRRLLAPPQTGAGAVRDAVEPQPIPDTPIVIRSYRGATVEEASMTYAAEAQEMDRRGYHPTGQTWTGPNRASQVIGIAGAIVLFYLLAGGIGIAFGILLGLLVLLRKADGTLTVTYARSSHGSPP